MIATRTHALCAGLVAAGLLAAAAPVSSQMPAQRLVRIGFGGGVAVPVSDAGSALKSGINGQAFVLVNLGGIPLRFCLGYQKLGLKEALAAGATGARRLLSGVGGVNLALLRGGPVTPYVTAGLGIFSLRDELAAGSIATPLDQTKFGIDGGAGLRLRLGPLEAFAEGRVQNIWTDQGAIDARSIRTVPVTFGMIL
ncbi:MAG: hypothetical protein FIB01_08770 [Gemmatimonadetes bacterium]|nr:hypothetical protein [Gemmatimonadota bacterium]